MSQEQLLAIEYLAIVGSIPKAPKTLVLQQLNAGAWGVLPVLMSVDRAEALDLATIRPGRR